jgi:hypothetical protein
MPDQPDFPPSPNFPINPPQNPPRSESPPPPSKDRREEDDYGYGPPSPFALWFGNLGVSGMLLTFGSLVAIFNWLVLYPAILFPAYPYLVVLSIICCMITLEASWILYQPQAYTNKKAWLIVTLCLVGVITLLSLYWFFETIKVFIFPLFLNLLACGTMTAGILMKAIGEGLFGTGGGGRRRYYDDYDDDYDDRDRRRRRDDEDDDREERPRRRREERDTREEEPRRESRRDRDRDDFDFTDRDEDRDRKRRDR